MKVEIRKIERGHRSIAAVFARHHFFFNVSESPLFFFSFFFFLSYLLMGDESGGATDVDRPLVSSEHTLHRYHLDRRERLFLELSYAFCVKMSPKNCAFLRFPGYVGEI